MKFRVTDANGLEHPITADVLVIHSSGVHEFINGTIQEPEFVASFSSVRSCLNEEKFERKFTVATPKAKDKIKCTA